MLRDQLLLQLKRSGCIVTLADNINSTFAPNGCKLNPHHVLLVLDATHDHTQIPVAANPVAP